MSRRGFLKMSTAAGTGALLANAAAARQPAVPVPVRTVYAVFKCHLDMGFIDTQANIVRRYWDDYIPGAIALAQKLKTEAGNVRYVWTMGSWLPYEFFQQMPADKQVMLDKAIRDGDIAYHAIPFTWETEMLDRSLLEGALRMAKALDRRFGIKTTAGKMTDVPGHTREIIDPLARAGITLLDIGVNPASTPPDVPDLFRWRDRDGKEIVVLYHRWDYGSTVTAPGAGIALSINVRGDNSGPHSEGEVRSIFSALSRQYPAARIVACGLSTIANALWPLRHTLPLVEQEIGDTWIYGCASDPIKVSRYREMSRLRQEWIRHRHIHAGDITDMAMLPWLSLVSEHTWGCDVKSIIGDYGIYKPADLKTALSRPNFQKAVSTWEEKRQNVDKAVAALPTPLRTEAQQRLAGLQAAPPNTAGLSPVDAGEPIESSRLIVALDAETGSIARLTDRKTGREWADALHPLALFRYQTFDAADYRRFLGQYVHTTAAWAAMDFGKPGIDKFPLVSRLWLPRLAGIRAGKDRRGTRLVADLVMPPALPELADLVGWPGKMTLEILMLDHSPALEIDFQWFDKPANRLPEALWISFIPLAPDPKGWTIDKVDRSVSPLDVIKDGNRHMHAVTQGAAYHDDRGRFGLETLDAPVIAPGQMSLLDFNNTEPDMSGGVHVNLFNNAWGTNYVMWYGEDTRFRFQIEIA